ncbi:sigma-54 dependent transcriptional regulator [Belliella sp. DSM 111904]|uniref:Sigma-54 dependent transcriptional regulator n=1 Tax=Belliella filtrata TaxID=2923435 RepID=A0ABS9V0T9_9BACT|nr:sigma-54 dependent transcriptional regulator [Belliella filtrata]MCH7410017.1 sigma-54 dependent transcriptional regulator [Belliella filtrata]
MEGKILLIDDEKKLRELTSKYLEYEGYEVIDVENIHYAKSKIDQISPDLVICDVKLPDGNGVDFCINSKKKFPDIEFILLTAYGRIQDGVHAVKNGVFDYLVKGDDNDKLLPLVEKAITKAKLQKELSALKIRIGKKYSFDSIIGQSESIKKSVTLAKKVANSDTTVLLTGATGTGKEVFAQAIHYESRRSIKPFVAINCSAISGEILESELFGHKSGAFTGAQKDKRGLFEEAHKGTMFLDEIGEMPMDLQAKFLRVLESGTFIPVGDTKEMKVDVRIIAATNRNLDEEVKNSHFREDLLYRLSVIQIKLPSLAERKEDIPELVKHFTGIFAAKTNQKALEATPEFLKEIQNQPFKGNIRELRNIIERAVILSNGKYLTPDLLPPRQLMKEESNLDFTMASAEKAQILRVLNFVNGNKTQAAKLLEIGLTTLYKKLHDYQIE